MQNSENDSSPLDTAELTKQTGDIANTVPDTPRHCDSRRMIRSLSIHAPPENIATLAETRETIFDSGEEESFSAWDHVEYVITNTEVVLVSIANLALVAFAVIFQNLDKASYYLVFMISAFILALQVIRVVVHDILKLLGTMHQEINPTESIANFLLCKSVLEYAISTQEIFLWIILVYIIFF